MAEQSTLELDDVVLLTDLADNSGRSNPHAALGRVIGFMDPTPNPSHSEVPPRNSESANRNVS